MWVDSKTAADILNINYQTLMKSVKRKEKQGKKFCQIKLNILSFRYLDGMRGGNGGKVLQIWIEDDSDVIEEINNASDGDNLGIGSTSDNNNDDKTKSGEEDDRRTSNASSRYRMGEKMEFSFSNKRRRNKADNQGRNQSNCEDEFQRRGKGCLFKLAGRNDKRYRDFGNNFIKFKLLLKIHKFFKLMLY